MRIQCDSLKYARLLGKKGVKSCDADDLMSTFTEIEIFNIYNKLEVDTMISGAVDKVFVKHDRSIENMLLKHDRLMESVFAKQDEKLAEQRREFNVRMQDMSKYHESQIREQRNESLTSRRWLAGTVITVGLSLAAYLSALIQFNH